MSLKLFFAKNCYQQEDNASAHILIVDQTGLEKRIKLRFDEKYLYLFVFLSYIFPIKYLIPYFFTFGQTTIKLCSINNHEKE